MTEEQKKELFDAIEYDEDKASISSAVDVPKDVSAPFFVFYTKSFVLIYRLFLDY
jgi:hypothetical protein